MHRAYLLNRAALLAAMAKQGLGVRQLSIALIRADCDVAERTVRLWMDGTTLCPLLRHLEALARVLEVPYETLLTPAPEEE